jgi:hypothetical protein
MQSSRLVTENNNTTIKQWTKGLGRKWPGGIVWAAIRTSPFYHVVIMQKKRVVAVVSNQRFRLKRENIILGTIGHVGN